MNGIEPVVRHMLLCDDVQHDPDNPVKLNVIGLANILRSTADPPFPFKHPQLCVYLHLTGGRGTGQAQVVAVHGDSDQVAFASPVNALSFGSDPLALVGVIFRMRNCPFPEAGLYWIQFRYNGKVIAQQPLVVR
jgi:hypothetical protein